MPKYFIGMHGTHLFAHWVEGRVRRLGFYQNHWVKAPDLDTAVEIARSRILNDSVLANTRVEDSRRDLLRLKVYEWREVLDFKGIGSNPSGFAFYLEYPWWDPRSWRGLLGDLLSRLRATRVTETDQEPPGTTSIAVKSILADVGITATTTNGKLVVPATSVTGYDVTLHNDLVVGFGDHWHYHSPDASECLFTFFRGLYDGTRLTIRLAGRHVYHTEVHVLNAAGGWTDYGSVVRNRRQSCLRRRKVRLINSHLTRDQAEAACAKAHRLLTLPWPEDANPKAGA